MSSKIDTVISNNITNSNNLNNYNDKMNSITVQKRNGQFENLSLDKITYRISKLSNGLNVNPSQITLMVCNKICDKIQTRDIDIQTANICSNLGSLHPDYAELASRILVSNHHKNTLINQIKFMGLEPAEETNVVYKYSTTVEILYSNMVNGVHCPLVTKEYYDMVLANRDKIDNAIDYERDYLFDYFGIKTLERSYLLANLENHNNSIGKNIIERIQDLFMRVSLAVNKDDIDVGIRSYNYTSQKYFTHATPTLYNAGTKANNLASCFLVGTDDSLTGIYDTIKDIALISQKSGGVGIHISNIRSNGSYIKGTNGTSNGIIPMLRVYNDTARYVNQGGKRPGCFAVYLEPHHPEIMEFLNLRKNHGNEEERTRDLFLALWVSDLFMTRVKNNGMWSTFDPNLCPKLNDVYGDEYEELYLKYEQEGKYSSQIPAATVWKAIVTSQIESGMPFILYKDHINNKSNHKNIGIIRSSNLCCEIVEYSDKDEYAVCTLASLGLPMFVDDNGKFDYDKLVEVMDVVVNNLNNVIDYGGYPVDKAKLSNMKHRPMGIGIQGLADVFAKMKIAFDSDEAREVNRNIAETMYYGALLASNKIAMRDGSYSTFNGSPISEGLFQFDLWNVKPRMTDKWDWEGLRENIKKYGVRNSLLIALMPTASTSIILNNTEMFEPITSNIYTRNTISGTFLVVNKYLVKELMEIGLWNEDMKNKIIYYEGSVQNITEIPDDIRRRYKTIWEIKQKHLIDMAAERAPFIDQTQSMNLYFENSTYSTISSALFYGWTQGIKTGVYYCRTKPKAKAIQFTIDPTLVNQINNISVSNNSPKEDKKKDIVQSDNIDNNDNKETTDEPVYKFCPMKRANMTAEEYAACEACSA